MHASDPLLPDHIPQDSDLYIPRKASSEVWRAFRLSYADQSRAWCTVCRLWLTWKKTTSNLLLHCHTWHATDQDGRISRVDRPPRGPGAHAGGSSALGRRDRSGSTIPQPSNRAAAAPAAGAGARAGSGAEAGAGVAAANPAQPPAPPGLDQAGSAGKGGGGQGNDAGGGGVSAGSSAGGIDSAIGALPALLSFPQHSAQLSHLGHLAHPALADPAARPFPPGDTSSFFPFGLAALGNLASWQTNAAAAMEDTPMQVAGQPLAQQLVDAQLSHPRPLAARHIPGPLPSDQLFAEETVRFLVLDMLPPQVLEGEGFRMLTRVLAAGYQPPSQQTIVRELEALHARVSDQVALSLSHADKFALSVEVWPSTASHQRFATVNAHFVDPSNCRPKSFALLVYQEPLRADASLESTGELKMKREGEVARAAISESISQWKIDPDRIIATTASVAAATLPLGGMEARFQCVADLLQQTMSRAIRNHESAIRRVCSKARVEGAVFQSGGADWLSDCQAIRLCAKVDASEYKDLHDDLEVVESLHSVMHPVRQSVEPLEALEFIPLGLVRRHLELIVSAATTASIGRDAHPAVRQTTFQMAQDISDALTKMTADHDETMILSSILDPRNRTHEREYAFSVLKRHCGAESSVPGVTSSEARGAAEQEVRGYLSENDMKKDESLAQWWFSRKDKYPVLSRIMRKVMCVSSTCLPPQRAFRELTPGGKSKNLVGRRRKLLCELSDVSPAYIQACVFLNNNLNEIWM